MCSSDLGNRRYIPVHDLFARNFADRNGEFQLELNISSIRTLFEVDLRMPANATAPSYLNAYKGVGHGHHGHGHGRHTNAHPKLETTYFSFGGFDWNVAVFPNGRDVTEERLLVFLNRLTGFDHQCRVRYMMVLGKVTFIQLTS